MKHVAITGIILALAFSAAAASLPESTFAVQKTSNGLRPKSAVEKRTNGDGTVTYLVRMGTSGTQLIVR